MTTPGAPELVEWAITGLIANTQYWFRIAPMINGEIQQVCAMQTVTTIA